jgi:fibronectin-binding autotransporter adhesin
MKKILGASLAAAVSLAGASQAQDLYWGSGGGGAWSTPGNWYLDAEETEPSESVPGATNDLIFNTIPDNGLGGSVTFSEAINFARSLTFDTSAATTLTQNGASRTLVIGAGGVTMNSGAGAVTLGVSTHSLFVELSESQTWTNDSTTTLTSRRLGASNLAAGPVTLTLNAANSGNISTAFGLTDSPDGTKSLSLIVDSVGSGTVSIQSSSYTGGTTLKRGILASSGNVGTGTVVISGTGSDNTRLHLSGAATNQITIQAGSSGVAALTGVTGADFQGDIHLERDVALGSASGNGQTILFSGNISGTGNITIGRVGGSVSPTVVLSGNNTYVGKTTIDSATVVVDSLNSVVGGSASSSLGAAPLDVVAGTIRMSAVAASTLRYVGTGETSDRVIEVGSNLGATLEHAGSGTLKFTSDLAHSGSSTRTLTLSGTSAGLGEFAGAIDNIGSGTNVGVAKSGSGTWRLSGTSNTYGSSTTITAGVLEVVKVADTGQASSIGTGQFNQLVLNGGTIRYIGSGDSSNRAFTIGANGATFDASGSGAVQFTRTSAPGYTGGTNIANSITLTGTNADDNVYGANQNNNGTGEVTITKEGSGKWILTGSMTYTGATTVNEGTLLLNGSGVSDVTVVGGVFGGTGRVNNSVTVGNNGTLAPGNSVGVIHVGDLVLAGTTSGIAMEIAGSGMGQYDQVSVTGGVNLEGNGRIEISLLSFIPDPSEIYFLILNDGVDAIHGTLFGIAQGGTFESGGYIWQVSYTGDSATNSFTGGNDLALQVVPEPSTMLLLGGGLTLVVVLRRRRAA